MVCNIIVYSKSAKRTHDLWWNGLPPSVRGLVWKLAIGNDLNVTSGELCCGLSWSAVCGQSCCGRQSVLVSV